MMGNGGTTFQIDPSLQSVACATNFHHWRQSSLASSASQGTQVSATKFRPSKAGKVHGSHPRESSPDSIALHVR